MRVWFTFCSLCGSLCHQNQPCIYVGGFWLIDIHSVDIIYNGIQFALNHSPNASSESPNTHEIEKERENTRDENETRRFRSARNLFHFSHAFFSFSIFHSRFIVPQQQPDSSEPVQYNTLHEEEFKYKF